MKKKILIGLSGILFFLMFGAFTESSNAAICHQDDQGICRIEGYGQWLCYCSPDDTRLN